LCAQFVLDYSVLLARRMRRRVAAVRDGRDKE
jgi:hypothetical protein